MEFLFWSNSWQSAIQSFNVKFLLYKNTLNEDIIHKNDPIKKWTTDYIIQHKLVCIYFVVFRDFLII